MFEYLAQLFAPAYLRATAIIVVSIFLAYLVEFILRRTLGVLVAKTATDLDDKIVEHVRQPIFLSVLIAGLGAAIGAFELSESSRFWIRASLETLAVIVWTVASIRIGSLLVHTAGERSGAASILQPRTIPVFDMLVKIAVVGAALYFIFVAWELDLTAWLASAGIVGIAVGFAAKDSLSNLFSGIFILADAPYKLGDWIIVDGTIRGNLRGRVINIGMRSTRIVTRDDVEITIPNAVIANSQLINETGGPIRRQRVRVAVDVAYGSDVDLVREVLLSCADEHELVEKDPEPVVRFRRFGESGLAFELCVYLEDPSTRGLMIDELNTNIYKAFAAAGIEIPYRKHDVYIKQLPRSD